MISPQLSLRLIAPNDYSILEDGQPIGRIRLAREHSPAIGISPIAQADIRVRWV
jgi:hypothetical protein